MKQQALLTTSLLSACSALTVLLLAPRTPARDVVIAVCVCWSVVVTTLAPASVASAAVDVLACAVVPAMWIVSKYGHAAGLAVVVPAFAFVLAAAVRLSRAIEGQAAIGWPTSLVAGALTAAVTTSIALATSAVASVALLVGAVLLLLPQVASWSPRWLAVVLAVASTAALSALAYQA